MLCSVSRYHSTLYRLEWDWTSEIQGHIHGQIHPDVFQLLAEQGPRNVQILDPGEHLGDFIRIHDVTYQGCGEFPFTFLSRQEEIPFLNLIVSPKVSHPWYHERNAFTYGKRAMFFDEVITVYAEQGICRPANENK